MNWKCEVCGVEIESGEEVFASQWTAEDGENRVAICIECHDAEQEAIRESLGRERYFVPARPEPVEVDRDPDAEPF